MAYVLSIDLNSNGISFIKCTIQKSKNNSFPQWYFPSCLFTVWSRPFVTSGTSLYAVFFAKNLETLWFVTNDICTQSPPGLLECHLCHIAVARLECPQCTQYEHSELPDTKAVFDFDRFERKRTRVPLAPVRKLIRPSREILSGSSTVVVGVNAFERISRLFSNREWVISTLLSAGPPGLPRWRWRFFPYVCTSHEIRLFTVVDGFGSMTTATGPWRCIVFTPIKT